MRALILAGGLGTRLRPLTHTRPKHLLPIANRPHIEHVLELLEGHGITEAVLATSYLAEAFTSTIENARRRGFKVELSHEREPLGTAGAIKNSQGSVGDGTFLVFNGDILTDVDLGALLSFHRDRGAEATIFLTPVEDPSAFGVVPTDRTGRVLGFIEKPAPGEAPTNLINAGVYVMEPSVLDRIPAGSVWSAEHQLFPQLVEEGAALYARAFEGYWIDIGTPASLLRANLDALEGTFRTDAVPEPGPLALLAADGSRLDEGAHVETSCLGTDVTVDSAARVERSVLMAGVRIGAGARVTGSILGEGVEIAVGVEVTDQTVGDRGRITA